MCLCPRITPGSQFDFQRKHRLQLLLGKFADVALAVVSVANPLLRHPGNRLPNLRLAEKKRRRIPIVELAAVLADGVHAVLFQIDQHTGDDRSSLGVGLKKSLLTLLHYLHGNLLNIGIIAE